VIVESDQNRPQADGAGHPSGVPDHGPGLGHSKEAELPGSQPERPHQADRREPSTAGHGREFTAEPDFSAFTTDVRESLLPRWLHVSLLWVLGLGAGAALILAGLFVTQERKTDKTLELLAVSSRSGLDEPAKPVAVPVADKKPTDMVFLQDSVKTAPARAERLQPAPESAIPSAVSVTRERNGASADTRPAIAPVASASPDKASPTNVSRPKTSAAKTSASKNPAARKPAARASIAKAKPAVNKKRTQRKGATVLARRDQPRTWPRRGDSITERLNAAVAACRARPHAPGECNLRACDILGSEDPACR
jgi:hypothetical protein